MSVPVQSDSARVSVTNSKADAPLSCLIGEDAALIGLALESFFEDQGFVCATISSTGGGLRWLEENIPSVAILDYMLKDGPCTALAGALIDCGVPFVIYSGYPSHTAPAALQGIPWIGKPADRATLLRTLLDLLASPSGARAA